jgi:hypothetical protein
MPVNIPPDLRQQKRQIRGCQFVKDDLLCLIEDRRKIPSTAMNAFSARLQDLDDAPRDYVIFSSWLGPLAAGKVKEGSMAGYGSIIGHVLAAVSIR